MSTVSDDDRIRAAHRTNSTEGEGQASELRPPWPGRGSWICLEPGPEASSNDRKWIPLLVGLLVTVAFSARFLVIEALPVVYHYDAFARLWNPRDLFVRHWLPIPQAPIFLIDSFGGTLIGVRATYALVGSLASGAVAWAVARAWSWPSGLAAGWLVAFYPPFFIATIVPYQEGFLLLFGALALGALTTGPNDGRPMLRGFASVSLALACLSRYEAWLLTAILLTGALLRRDWRRAVVTVPSLVVMACWIVTLQFLPLSDGPPRTAESPIFVHLLDGNLFDQSSRIAHAAARLLSSMLREAGLPVALLVILGLVSLRRRGVPPFRTELPLLVAALVGLSAVRAVNAGYTSLRMMLGPSMWLLFAAGIGLAGLAALFRGRWAIGIRVVLVGTLASTLAVRSVQQARIEDHKFRRDYDASRILLSLPPIVNVALLPRPSPDILGQSMVGAIMGQSLDLNPSDPRWSYPGRTTPSHEPSALLFWDGKSYSLRELSRTELRSGPLRRGPTDQLRGERR